MENTEKRAINAYLEDYQIVYQFKNINLLSGQKCSIADALHQIIVYALQDPQFTATVNRIKTITSGEQPGVDSAVPENTEQVTASELSDND